MRKPLDHQCPECQTDLGVPRAVSTIPGRRGFSLVTMVCQSCGQEWKVEQRDVVDTSNPRIFDMPSLDR